MARDQRRLAAIVSADVAGYSRLMGLDDSDTLARLKAHRRELIDPKIAESWIVINGKELSDSGLILSGGLKDAQVRAMSAGDNLQFAVGLGDHFTEPGTYRVCWKGTGFQSPEILLRILPVKAQ